MKNRYERHSLETEVAFEFLPAGERNCIETPCGFLNHMIDLFLHRAGIPGRLTASGDVEVDAHHLVEDVGILMGAAFLDLFRKGPCERYGSTALPMDGTLVLVALDISGRGGLTWDADFPAPRCGTFDTELVREFWTAFSREARLTLHVRALSVDNSHHLAEAVFKGTGRALKEALVPSSLPSSTKGTWV